MAQLDFMSGIIFSNVRYDFLALIIVLNPLTIGL